VSRGDSLNLYEEIIMRTEELNRVEFDCPFLVGKQREAYPLHTVPELARLYGFPANVHAPSVWHDDTADIVIESDQWEAFSVGYTGQWSYNGAVMHASEYLGGRLADDILETPGVYVVVAVEVFPEEGDEEPEPAGWTVLRLRDSL
jgi:hypothetical protein